MKKVVVTGGGGFIGSYLVRRLVSLGWDVSVVDSMIRGRPARLEAVSGEITLFNCDVRDEASLVDAFEGAEVVFHLAAVNGTENFYRQPELVLDVGIRGAIAVMNAARHADVPDVVVASTAEVYQTPEILPTPETVALTLPNSTNPRYSYGCSKIASELIALNYGQDHFRRVQIFRPHNVYGPDMGWKHVIPEFLVRAADIRGRQSRQNDFQIQGNGAETRAFAFVEDVVSGIITMYERGVHREIYHIGNDEEVAISDLVSRIGQVVGANLQIVASEAAAGGTPRRCPDITKMRLLGYDPKIGLSDGLSLTAEWYLDPRNKHPENHLL